MMRLFATTVSVLLLASVAASIVSAEGCSHDSDIALLDGEKADLAKPAPTNLPEEGEGRLAAGFTNIRIKFSTLDLEDTNKYCASSSGTVSDFKGGSIACTADTVLTAAKKAELLNVVLPHAKQMLENALLVKPLTSNLKVASTTQCSNFVFASSDVTTGVAGADFYLAVGAAPTSGSTVAWAASCQSDGGSPKRAIVGRMNFSPKYLLSTTFNKNLALATGVHEILHAMGFSSSWFADAGIVGTHTVRGRNKKFITAGSARKVAMDYIGCQSATLLPGVELEDEGGTGTAGSHVDRRVYKSDIMAGTSGLRLSVITLAVMESLGVYEANFSAAQSMIVGLDAGCGYVSDSNWCATDEVHFCQTDGVVGCSSDVRGYGPCSKNSPLMTDGCGYHNPYSNRQCDNVALPSDATGNTFHKDSRCVVTSGGFGTGSTSSTPERCLRSRCVSGILSFNAGGSSWAVCTTSGATVAGPTGSTGSIVCPNITRYCISLSDYANSSYGFGPLPPAEPVASGKDNRASVYVYTALTELFLSGSGWGSIIKNKYSELLVAISLDVAQHLGLQSQQTWLRSTSSGDTWVRILVSINDPKRSPEQIQAIWDAAINAGGRNWMPRTANLYSSSSGAGDTPVLASASTSGPPTNACASAWMELAEKGDVSCNFAIFGLVCAVLCGIALFGFTIWRCCCQYAPPPNDWKYLVPPVKEPIA